LGGPADLERQLTESRAREAALAEVLGVMRRAPGELSVVLDAVLERAAGLCGAERASIHVLDGDVYRTAAFWGPRNPEYERSAYETTRKPGRETLIGRTALERAVVHIPDVLSDSEYTATDLQRLGGYRTMLGVPLFRGETVAGVFVLTRDEVRPFTDQEIALVRAFADQAVVAVENARLIKGTQEALERQTAVSEVLEDMSRSVFDLERVLKSVAMNAVRLCAADNGSIAQLKADGWRLVANVGDIDEANMERNWANRPIDADRRSLTGRVLMDRRTTTIVDALADPEYDAGVGVFNVRSLVGVPLTRGEEIVGVLILRREEPRPFTPEQIRLLETFADQASIAIENVRLFNETKEALERQTATGEILRVIASSPTEVQPVLDAIAESAARVCGATDAHVYRVDGDVLKQWAHFGPIPGLDPEESLPLTRGSVIGRSIVDRRAIHTKDAAELDAAEYPISVRLQERWGYRTALSVPLVRDGVGIGGIAIRRMEVRPFTAKQVELLETFADQAVIAIENVRLFNKTKEALDRQTAIGEVLRAIGSSAFELAPVLQAVAEHALRLCHAGNAVIWRTVGDSHRLATRVSGDADPGREALLELVTKGDMPIGTDSITGRAHLERRPIQVEDIAEYYRGATGPAADIARIGKMHTLLAVPLIRDDRVLGVIALTRMEKRLFSDSEVELVQTFADQAAIAIANVELFETVERQRGELSRFLSPQVAELVTSEHGAKLLEGHRRQVTVVFCDLRNFTTFAETAEPEEVLGVLRDYHRAMGELIVEHRGTLEHFAGDGMMVFFNDPLPVERHELQALRMTFAMRARFDEMSRAWRKRGYELGFGVGIATGYATLGRSGFEGRYDYGAIGNVVILAQRLSSEAKAGQILISQRVQAAVEADAETTAVGDLTLKGFTRPVPAFAAESVRSPAGARP
jgi:GAF domain-containing protein